MQFTCTRGKNIESISIIIEDGADQIYGQIFKTQKFKNRLSQSNILWKSHSGKFTGSQNFHFDGSIVFSIEKNFFMGFGSRNQSYTFINGINSIISYKKKSQYCLALFYNHQCNDPSYRMMYFSKIILEKFVSFSFIFRIIFSGCIFCNKSVQINSICKFITKIICAVILIISNMGFQSSSSPNSSLVISLTTPEQLKSAFYNKQGNSFLSKYKRISFLW